MHLLQSPSWDTFQHSLHKTTFTASGKDWFYLATLEPTPLGTYLMVARGPALDTPSALKPALTSLKTRGGR